jgi:hypothetical protein
MIASITLVLCVVVGFIRDHAFSQERLGTQSPPLASDFSLEASKQTAHEIGTASVDFEENGKEFVAQTIEPPLIAASYSAEMPGVASDLVQSDPQDSVSPVSDAPIGQRVKIESAADKMEQGHSAEFGSVVLAAQIDDIDPLESLDFGFDGRSKTLHLNLGEVKNMHVPKLETFDAKITRIEVADPSVCEAVISNSTKIQFIAVGEGQTQVNAWVTVLSAGEESTQRQYQIQVMSFSEQFRKRFGDRLEVLNRSIRKVYPGCSVSIRVESNGLAVSGLCDSSESASGILAMIRKIMLVPVKDELEIQRTIFVPTPAAFPTPKRLPKPADCEPPSGLLPSYISP